MRHTDPRITTEFYGHLAPGYLRNAIDRLAFEATPSEPRSGSPSRPRRHRNQPSSLRLSQSLLHPADS